MRAKRGGGGRKTGVIEFPQSPNDTTGARMSVARLSSNARTTEARKAPGDTKSIRVICSAPPRAAGVGLYFSKLRVYLAREIAGNRPAEENIYCAVLSSHGKSEQRERILHRAGRSLPQWNSSLFSTSLSVSPSLSFSLPVPLFLLTVFPVTRLAPLGSATRLGQYADTRYTVR